MSRTQELENTMPATTSAAEWDERYAGRDVVCGHGPNIWSNAKLPIFRPGPRWTSPAARDATACGSRAADGAPPGRFLH